MSLTAISFSNRREENFSGRRTSSLESRNQTFCGHDEELSQKAISLLEYGEKKTIHEHDVHPV